MADLNLEMPTPTPTPGFPEGDDDEIFFGPMTDKEKLKSRKLRRKTQVFRPNFRDKDEEDDDDVTCVVKRSRHSVRDTASNVQVEVTSPIPPQLFPSVTSSSPPASAGPSLEQGQAEEEGENGGKREGEISGEEAGPLMDLPCDQKFLTEEEPAMEVANLLCDDLDASKIDNTYDESRLKHTTHNDTPCDDISEQCGESNSLQSQDGGERILHASKTSENPHKEDVDKAEHCIDHHKSSSFDQVRRLPSPENLDNCPSACATAQRPTASFNPATSCVHPTNIIYSSSQTPCSRNTLMPCGKQTGMNTANDIPSADQGRWMSASNLSSGCTSVDRNTAMKTGAISEPAYYSESHIEQPVLCKPAAQTQRAEASSMPQTGIKMVDDPVKSFVSTTSAFTTQQGMGNALAQDKNARSPLTAFIALSSNRQKENSNPDLTAVRQNTPGIALHAGIASFPQALQAIAEQNVQMSPCISIPHVASPRVLQVRNVQPSGLSPSVVRQQLIEEKRAMLARLRAEKEELKQRIKEDNEKCFNMKLENAQALQSNMASGMTPQFARLPSHDCHGIAALGLDEWDLDVLTKLHTIRNSQHAPASQAQSPCCMATRHKEPSRLQWHRGLVLEVEELSSPSRPRCKARPILSKTLKEPSSRKGSDTQSMSGHSSVGHPVGPGHPVGRRARQHLLF